MTHVLVTGAAGGIGRAIAEEFTVEGAAVTLADRDRAALEETAVRLGGSAHTVDLTDPEAPADLVHRAWESQGPVDVLVNAAGVYPSLDMADLRAEEWDRLFAVNLRAPVLATAAFARLAVEHGRAGSVVNISSGSALRARPGGGPYASSKAALEMATRAAALELGAHGIRVNAVSPGFVPVDSDCNPVSEEYAAAIGANPLGRPGTPRDIARAVRWIAGGDASWITGEILRVDGGSSTGALHLPRIWPPDGHDRNGSPAPGGPDTPHAHRTPHRPADAAEGHPV
ncbi:SDR family NAD(P)-dependent oxidoreductase [Streptomyces sp. NPDC088400]|uniref:SDR family NAD(P)-dependent oxidoreductase n=1 Tax=Streptomyces sp. NPDC088400 TaxID=3365861 RepID=UPI0037FF6D72